MKIYPGEEELFHALPAYTEPVNQFHKSVLDLPDAWPWAPLSSCVWDRAEGRRTPGSLRIWNNLDTAGGWQTETGPSFFGNPIEAGKRYQLNAWVRLRDFTGTGARLGLGFSVVQNLGTPREKVLPPRWHFSPTVARATDWTPLRLRTPPAPADTCSVVMALLLQGRGQAWFDDVQFAPVS